jgi:glycosidase
MSCLNRLLAALIILFGAATQSRADDYLLASRKTGNPAYQYHPSPTDWRDVNMYQLFTDRFSDGNTANSNIRGWYTTTGYRHYAMGGDWKGVRNKLDYLQGMGVNAVWISGVQINEQGTDTAYAPYHAYHPTDFYRVEPMFGTFQELKDLVDDAHSRGIYIILDVVINHMADLNGLGNGNDNFYHPWGGGNLFWWNGNKKHAWPLDNLAYFHNNGKIINWSDSGQILNGAFVGTDDLKTEDSFVQNHLLAAFKNLIDSTDCDGFRVDAIKHVERPFLMSWADAMRSHAATIGKNNFILFGENFDYNDNNVADHVKDPGGFNSALYFPMQITLKEVFAYEQATRKLQDRLNNLYLYGEGAQNLVTFMDNHDVDRIALECGDAWLQKLKPALTFLYTGTPVPCLFYGTEHGFNQGGVRNNGLTDGDYQRECMMNYGYQPGNANGDKFFASELYNYIKQLNALRKEYPVLTRGTMVNRWKDDSNKGLFAFSRTLGDQDALVVFNTDWATKTLSPVVGKPNGTVYINLLNTNETMTVSGGVLNNISVPSKGSKIFFAGTSRSDIQTTCTKTAITITYKPNKGPLENRVGNIILSIRSDGAVDAADFTMISNSASYSYTYALTNSTNSITFWFRDQKTPSPVYDNNGGSNWTVVTRDCWKTGINLAFVGNISTYPVAGEIDPGEDLWIDVQTWPKRAAFQGLVVYSADGGATWFAEDMIANGDAGNNDAWHANLGSFPRGVTVNYAVMMEGENGEVWNNNNSSNFSAKINTDIMPLTWVGNTYHWPNNGDIDTGDDLWINVESRPLAAGFEGSVVYSVDGGTNWITEALSHNGVTTNSDLWHVNLGKFPGETVVRYAVMVANEDNIQMWDNNNGLDFTATVNASLSSLQWYGNTRSFSVPPAELDLKAFAGITNIQLDIEALQESVTYTVCTSSNLLWWSVLEQFDAAYPAEQLLLDAAGGPGSTRFYCLRVDRGPAGPVVAGDHMTVTTETWPAGGASGVNIVFSADGGTIWNAKPMTLTGQAGSNDIWTVDLGVYPSGTSVRYAIEVIDDASASFWDNNSFQDYSVIVAP